MIANKEVWEVNMQGLLAVLHRKAIACRSPTSTTMAKLDKPAHTYEHSGEQRHPMAADIVTNLRV